MRASDLGRPLSSMSVELVRTDGERRKAGPCKSTGSWLPPGCWSASPWV
jgi:hypothetical protein